MIGAEAKKLLVPSVTNDAYQFSAGASLDFSYLVRMGSEVLQNPLSNTFRLGLSWRW